MRLRFTLRLGPNVLGGTAARPTADALRPRDLVWVSNVPGTAPGMIGIVQVTIPVTDLAHSAAWYRDLLSLSYVREFVTIAKRKRGKAAAAQPPPRRPI